MKTLGTSSKAHTLLGLVGKLETAVVLPVSVVTRSEWNTKPDETLQKATASLQSDLFAVRSSAPTEDLAGQTGAGRYLSCLDVTLSQVGDRIADVFDSYEQSDESDEVFLQPMATNIEMAGVGFSRDPSTGSDYRVVEYFVGDDARAVTGGAHLGTTYVSYRGNAGPGGPISNVLRTIEELEELFPSVSLDIEFVISADYAKPILLQVRALPMLTPSVSKELHAASLDRISETIRNSQQPHPYLAGVSTIFGVMPDWNPAEMIGIRPRPLAMSLYRDVITDSIWAYQRSNYGYRNLRGHPLMVEFSGQPFIDLRVSFNSFIPDSLPDDFANRLAAHYISTLASAPELHHNIESEIVHSCYTFGMDTGIPDLELAGFTKSDIAHLRKSLLLLTNNVIDPSGGLWKGDWDRVRLLDRRRHQILSSTLNITSKIHWLLEDCRRYGTLPFAGLARCGFIARQLLTSMTEQQILKQSRGSDFLSSIRTVSRRLVDTKAAGNKEALLLEFGHLRPGTYEISSPRYDESFDNFFDLSGRSADQELGQEEFFLSPTETQIINARMAAEGLVGDASSLIEFLRAGIELREESKFLFTRNISDILLLLSEWGESFGLSRDDMGYITIDCVRRAVTTSVDQKELLASSVIKGKAEFAECSATWLPSLITGPNDVYGFTVLNGEPNFVTQKSVIAEGARPTSHSDIQGKIALVPNADPGYDWLFAAGIVGLVTAYGGGNSHMAIRCHELGLPAAIGIGEQRLEKLPLRSRLLLDCATRRIQAIT